MYAKYNLPAIYKKAGSLNTVGVGGVRGITHTYSVPFIGIDTVMLVPLTLWPGRSPSNNSSSPYLIVFTSHDGIIPEGLTTHSNIALVSPGKRITVEGGKTNSKTHRYSSIKIHT